MRHCKLFDIDSIVNDIELIKTSIRHKKVEYYNISCALDIETTSTIINTTEKFAFMYIWQFGIKNSDNIYFGRTYSELKTLLKTLSTILNLNETTKIICYIHNLSYEFQFMRKHFTWLDVFATHERKPIKATCSLGIEFRDSYILSSLSLENTAKTLTDKTLCKKTGDLDYSIIRHHQTELTTVELDYCKRDIEIILAYINEQIAIYKNITLIPLTNTARVRNYVRDQCYKETNIKKLLTSKEVKYANARKYKNYANIIRKLPLQIKEYKTLKRAFQGGYTHANALKQNTIINDVNSVDINSSYPSVMCSELFPMGRGIETVVTTKNINNLLKNHALLLNVKFTNIKAIFINDNYISKSKCKVKDDITNNGRIFSASELITTITDIDYEIIKKTYTFDTIQFTECYRYCKSYLPKNIIISVLSLYVDKTKLKNDSASVTEYNLAKSMLNSIYGMSVTDITQDTIKYDDLTEWTTEKADIDDLITKYNNKKMRTLSYAWGVWITAYARRNLWSGILNINDDYIYSDTDSIKFTNYEKHKKYFIDYDNQISEKLKKMCSHHKINFKLCKPKDKLIGVWDYEKKYDIFKTLGAKRYLTKTNNKLELTLSGLSKKQGALYLSKLDKPFYAFNDNLKIESNETGKLTHTYIDTEQHAIIKDYKNNYIEVTSLSSVHLEKCEFSLNIYESYATFLKNLKSGYLQIGLTIKK